MQVTVFVWLGRRGHTPALRVHPAVQVVGDVTSRDVAQGTDGHGQSSAAFQHLHQDRQKLHVTVARWLHSANTLTFNLQQSETCNHLLEHNVHTSAQVLLQTYKVRAEHSTLRKLVYLWFPEFLRGEWGGVSI